MEHIITAEIIRELLQNPPRSLGAIKAELLILDGTYILHYRDQHVERYKCLSPTALLSNNKSKRHTNDVRHQLLALHKKQSKACTYPHSDLVPIKEATVSRLVNEITNGAIN
jgi:hypothetical protein